MKNIIFFLAVFGCLLAGKSLSASGCLGGWRKIEKGFVSYGDHLGTFEIPVYGNAKQIYVSFCEGDLGLNIQYNSRKGKIAADLAAIIDFYTGKTINGITVDVFKAVQREYAVTEIFKSCKTEEDGLYMSIYSQEKPPLIFVSVLRNDHMHGGAPGCATAGAPTSDTPLVEAADPVMTPEAAIEKTDAEKYEEDLAQLKGTRTIHYYKIGPIQKKRMLADIRQKAMRQGFTGQRLSTHMRGAKLVIDNVGAETFSMELKENGKMLFTQSGTSKIIVYRIRGHFLEVEKGDGGYKRFGKFNASKSTLSLLDPVYGRATVAILQK
ncbi:MAG: hypothetical protein KF713_13350 [Turneriella sp.]|nr:hypothetical protein [Turneriella sp.]